MTSSVGKPPATQAAKSEQGGPEHWAAAKQIASKLSYVPASFSTAVRTLVADHIQNGKKLRPVTKYQVGRLVQGQSFKTLIYYASKALHQGKLPTTTPWSVGQLLDLYEPFDVAALVSCFLFTRKCRKLLTPEQWASVESMMTPNSLVGAQVGVAIPNLGVGMGLIVNSFRWFGYAALVKKDEKQVVPYKIHLKKTGLKWDFNEERRLWGCSSKEIAVFFLSASGLGVETSDAFAAAIESTTPIENIESLLQLRARLSLMWVDAVQSGQSQPTQRLPGEYYPLAKLREQLDARTREILAGEKHFLTRTKAELTESLTPEMFGKAKAVGDVPQELAAIFSIEEITKMEENDFDKLIDQIDNEQEGKIIPGTVSAKDVKELEEMVAE